jgi:hypothetical protein
VLVGCPIPSCVSFWAKEHFAIDRPFSMSCISNKSSSKTDQISLPSHEKSSLPNGVPDAFENPADSGPEAMSKYCDEMTGSLMEQPTMTSVSTEQETAEKRAAVSSSSPNHADGSSSHCEQSTTRTSCDAAKGQTTTTTITTTTGTRSTTTATSGGGGGGTSESYSDRVSKHCEKRLRDVEAVSDLAVTTAVVATKSVWTYIRNIPKTWPRLYGIAFGVVVPVLSLLCVSLFLGYFLAEFESPAEIAGNNRVIAARAQTARASDFLGNVSAQLPVICLSAYFISNTTTIAERGGDDWLRELVQQNLYDIYVTDQSQHFNASTVEEDDNDIVRIDGDDVRDLPNYMRNCGAVVWGEAAKFIGSTSYYLSQDYSTIGELSFDWIRCFSEEVKGAVVPAFYGSLSGRGGSIFPHLWQLPALPAQECDAVATGRADRAGRDRMDAPPARIGATIPGRARGQSGGRYQLYGTVYGRLSRLYQGSHRCLFALHGRSRRLCQLRGQLGRRYVAFWMILFILVARLGCLAW